MKDVVKQKLSGEMLYKLGHATETHEAVCYALGSRLRVRDFSNINSLKWELRHEGFKIVEADYMQMWKDWQSAGLGVILLGRGKKQNKFIHYYDMRKIAQAAIDGKDVEVEVRNNDQKATIEEANTMRVEKATKSINSRSAKAAESPTTQKAITATPSGAARSRSVNSPPKAKVGATVAKPKVIRDTVQANHMFMSIRPNFLVDVNLPSDVTTRELELISAALLKCKQLR